MNVGPMHVTGGGDSALSLLAGVAPSCPGAFYGGGHVQPQGTSTWPHAHCLAAGTKGWFSSKDINGVSLTTLLPLKASMINATDLYNVKLGKWR